GRRATTHQVERQSVSDGRGQRWPHRGGRDFLPPPLLDGPLLRHNKRGRLTAAEGTPRVSHTSNPISEARPCSGLNQAPKSGVRIRGNQEVGRIVAAAT